MAKKNEYNDLVLFLCSKSSSYITGSIIVSDGGRTMYMKKIIYLFYMIMKKPLTNYPAKFAEYNINRFGLKNKVFLEIGCGRGDFINEFSKNVICYATDILLSAKE